MQYLVNLVGLIRKKLIYSSLEVNACLFLMYGTEACCLKKSDINSLDFAVNNRFVMKLFKTINMSIIEDCRTYFNFKLPSTLLVTRKTSFLDRYNSCNDNLCEQILTTK